MGSPRRVAIGLAGALALIAIGVLGHYRGQSHIVLTGPRIQLAGYRFGTPAGFRASSTACAKAISLLEIQPHSNTFTAAGVANGPCVAGSFVAVSRGALSLILEFAHPRDVGGYQGYDDWGTDPHDHVFSELYVHAPAVGGHDTPYLVLTAQDLTVGELADIAISGLPSSR